MSDNRNNKVAFLTFKEKKRYVSERLLFRYKGRYLVIFWKYNGVFCKIWLFLFLWDVRVVDKELTDASPPQYNIIALLIRIIRLKINIKVVFKARHVIHKTLVRDVYKECK